MARSKRTVLQQWEDRCKATVEDNPRGFKWGFGPTSNFLLGRVAPLDVPVPDTRNYVMPEEPNSYRKTYLITALRDIPEHGVKAGDQGGSIDAGVIPSEDDPDNGVPPSDLLDDDGACWLGPGAHMIGLFHTERGHHQKISGAHVRRSVLPAVPPRITGNALLRGTSSNPTAVDIIVGATGGGYISGDVTVEGSGIIIEGEAFLADEVKVRDSASLWGGATAFEKAQLRGNSSIRERARVSGESLMDDNAVLDARARLRGTSQVFGGAVVKGTVLIEGESVVCTESAEELEEERRRSPATEISGGTKIVDSFVTGGQVLGKSELTGGSLVAHRALVVDSTLADGAKVYNDGVVVENSNILGGEVSGGVVSGGIVEENETWEEGECPPAPEEEDPLENSYNDQFGDFAGKDINTYAEALKASGVTLGSDSRECGSFGKNNELRYACTHKVTDETKACAAGHVPAPRAR